MIHTVTLQIAAHPNGGDGGDGKNAWLVTPSGVDVLPFAVARVDHDGRAFPQAPGGVDASTLATTLDELRTQRRDPQAVAALGRTLFDALVEPWWSALGPAITAAKTRPAALELALRLDGAPELAGLPWEMMVGRDGKFLARGVAIDGVRLDVVVTRRVARPPVATAPLAHPLRYLFVIGDELDDSLRAGAECMGLLRQLGPRIDDRVLMLRTASRSLAETVDEFRPQIVHVIAHGVEAADGSVLLALFDRATNAVRPTPAAELAGLLVRSGDHAPWCPTAVILSACSGGQPLGGDGHAGLAGTLVGAGVPVVVGMAAEVSDLACRLFARQLGAALVDGVPLAIAAARGRGAALRDPAMPAGNLDWGLVNLMLGEDISAELAVPAVTKDSSADRLLGRMAAYSLPIDTDRLMRRLPPFVGRADVFAAFHELLAGRGPAALCLLACPPRKQHKVGKRRTMAELAAAALRAGHIPVVAMPRIGSKQGVPRTVDDLIRELGRALLLARTVFGAPAETPRLDAALAAHPGDTMSLRSALAAELLALRDAVRASDELVGEREGEVVVFANDVHLFGDAIEPWFSELLGGLGLGTTSRIPVVTSYAQRAPDDKEATWGQRDAWVEELVTRNERHRLRGITLGPLAGLRAGDSAAVPLDERLAYQRVLLHPFRDQPEWATRPWFLDLRSEPARLAGVLKFLRNGTGRGCPGTFATDEFFQWVDAANELQSGTLHQAQDDDVLRGRGEP